MKVKVYVIQRVSGEIVAAKLTRAAAQAVAKKYAPARVVFLIADKDSGSDHTDCS